MLAAMPKPARSVTARDDRQPAAVRLRRTTRRDGPAVVRLIAALAAFEHLPPPTPAARARLLADGFGRRPLFETWVAEVPESKSPVGYAIFFPTYSTFLARPTLYLEDIFVLPAFRGRGIGTAFMRQCIQLAHDRGCGRMEWTCLDWNKRAQAVYEKTLGARRMSEWYLYRLVRPELAAILRGASGARSTRKRAPLLRSMSTTARPLRTSKECSVSRSTRRDARRSARVSWNRTATG